MKRLYILIFFVLGISFGTNSQVYIGKHKNEIIELMNKHHQNFKLNKDVINRTYNYLKYEDNISEQTLLFFLSEDNYCTFVRWMSDYANINDMISMLDSKYIKSGKDTWTYSDNGKKYIIKLEEGEWFFTVSFRILT